MQIALPDDKVYLVKNPTPKSKNLKELLDERNITKIFHNAAFDIRFLKASLLVNCVQIECTKTMMKIHFPEIHSGLGSTLEHILGVKIDKNISHKGWNANKLSKRQLEYATTDVLYLIELYDQLSEQMIEQHTFCTYSKALEAIIIKSYLEVEGYVDLFEYKQESAKSTKRYKDWWNKLNH